jgi:hypothetical protein
MREDAVRIETGGEKEKDRQDERKSRIPQEQMCSG